MKKSLPHSFATIGMVIAGEKYSTSPILEIAVDIFEESGVAYSWSSYVYPAPWSSVEVDFLIDKPEYSSIYKSAMSDGIEPSEMVDSLLALLSKYNNYGDYPPIIGWDVAFNKQVFYSYCSKLSIDLPVSWNWFSIKDTYRYKGYEAYDSQFIDSIDLPKPSLRSASLYSNDDYELWHSHLKRISNESSN